MANMFDIDYSFDDVEDESYQESCNISASHYKDLFNSAFTPFSPDTIINGNNSLKSGQFDMDIEDSELKLGYVNPIPASFPPVRFE